MRIHVLVDASAILSLTGTNGKNVTMIPFCGEVKSKLFEGNVLPGAVDTQVTSSNGTDRVLSARYMLEGTDFSGQKCKIYIENTGVMYADISTDAPLFTTNPKIITDSKALDFLNNDFFVSQGIPSENGITVIISSVKHKNGGAV